MSPH
jgi:hypothetical protein